MTEEGPVPGNGSFPVVGIGASAGGFEAFTKLLEALPADTGIAFVLVSHLDPTRESMLVDLLAIHTMMKVVQAADGMPLETNCVYIIPPSAFLSVHDGVLRVSQPQVLHGARLPFDFLLNSLADQYGERAVCVVLSGTGGDGSAGLKAVSERGGLVIAQDPQEAGYDGMPKTAIATGAVNLVLPAAQIPQALIRYARHPYLLTGLGAAAPDEHEDKSLGEIIELLRARTSRDFARYRKATLLRRIQRRMAAAGIEQITNYISRLREDGHELDLLAKDFLIHVTSFFRDPAAFEALAKTVIPGLVRQAADQPIRVWVPGCSTGEEAYSLAMLFLEEAAAAKHAVKLQMFASDIAADALDFGRDGVYPETIRDAVSVERLQRFFTRRDQDYQVSRELREAVVFSLHDLLEDPPFSKLDLISCRNLLIYLQPEEQHKILSLFHFALSEGGYLFLGAAETIGQLAGLFVPISNTLHIFRRDGQGRPRDGRFLTDFGERARVSWPRRFTPRVDRRPPNLTEVVERQLLETYAPAAVVVDDSYRALYFSGPTDRYLRIPPGEASPDVLPMLREGLASRFRAAVRQASREHAGVSIGGARIRRNGDFVSVRISARPLQHDGAELVLVNFVDEPEPAAVGTAETPDEASRAVQLEQELEDTRKELESTIRELEDSNQELNAINEEALSINEEYQSTNEELETAKEELQSLNEELTTTNNQLQETLDRQRRTSDDLQNILNSSDAATLFLDQNLNIRFFTPSAASLFNLIASDIGRPLADFANPFSGFDLIADARQVLADLATIGREARSTSGAWYTYRTSPYRTQDNRIEGVVISLSDISGAKAVELEVGAARAYAEAIIDTVQEPLIVLDEAMNVVSASRSFYRFFGASADDTVDRPLVDSDARHLDVPALRAFLDRVKGSSDNVQSSEIEVDLPEIGHRILVVTAEHIRHDEAATRWILISLKDITDVRHSEQQLAASRAAAEQANLAKSRFLAAVSHDLRQPLQTLTLLHGALRREAKTERLVELLGRAEETFDSMSGMLNALLDINQLESGTIQPQAVDFPINDLLGRLDSEFGLHARAHGLGWRVVRCRLGVHTDPRLLEQMLRNLLSNAIRYTEEGRVLLGCRRRGDKLRIEVWDTGIGMAEEELPNIFGEYQRVTKRAGGGSLGLGLAIVQRLGELLDHAIGARSQLNKGSVFTIEVPLAPEPPAQIRGPIAAVDHGLHRRGTILVIEDDPAVREMLQLMLAREGHRTAVAGNGNAALALVQGNGFRPDLVVSDYILPGGMNGVETVAAVRSSLGAQVPVVFLTGDIGHASLRDLALSGAVRFAKPVKPEELSRSVQQLLAASSLSSGGAAAMPPGELAEAGAPMIYVIDDDRSVRDTMSELLTGAGYRVEAFASGEAFLAGDRTPERGCLVTDARMPGMSGFELLARLAAAGSTLPAIVLTGHGDVAIAVEAMKAGAVDFIEKPVRPEQILACIERALRHAKLPAERSSWQTEAAMRVAGLTRREHEVMDHVVAGHANKETAARLGVAQRTVETHRAKVMKKMGAASLSDLVRLVIAAQGGSASA